MNGKNLNVQQIYLAPIEINALIRSIKEKAKQGRLKVFLMSGN